MDDTSGLSARVNDWLAHPFKATGSVWDWFLFLGVIIVAVFLWTQVLGKLREAYSEVIT